MEDYNPRGMHYVEARTKAYLHVCKNPWCTVDDLVEMTGMPEVWVWLWVSDWLKEGLIYEDTGDGVAAL